MRNPVGSILIGVTLASVVLAGSAEATVTLELRPASQTATAGQQVSAGLYAVANPSEPVGILHAVLQWDANFLTLSGQDPDGTFPWSSVGFPGGGLNTSFTDGDAFFTANVAPCTPAMATPQGLLVTTLVFDVGSNVGTSSVSIVSSLGGFDTRVWNNLTVFNCGGAEVAIALGQSASVTVQACTDAADCADGTACTNDACNAGVCEHAENFDATQSCCNPSNGGLTTLFDDNDCTGQNLPGSPGLCNPTTGQVSHFPKFAGSPCGDQTSATCTDPDTCDGASFCLPNHAQDGNFCELDGDSCTNDACSNGACTFVDSDADGTACDDGQDNCTPGQDECQAGVCVGTGVDPCIGQQGNFCLENESAGPDCPNGDSDCVGFPDSVCDDDPLEPKCRRPYTCGQCRPGFDDCPDDGDCLAPTCSFAGVCLDFLENDVCQDGTYCNGEEVCDPIFQGQLLIGGQCIADVTPPCVDTGLVCREETCCDAQTQTCGEDLCACVDCLITADCDDSNPCNGLETCDQVSFTCMPGVDVDCSHLDDQCLVGVCDPLGGTCEAQPANAGSNCDDGATCTINDQCTAEGLCEGTSDTLDGSVDLQWDEMDPSHTQTSQAVGETVRFELWAAGNDGQACSITGTPCPGGVGDCSFVCQLDGLTPCASSNDCVPIGGGFCNVAQQCLPSDHEVTVIQSIVNFDPNVFQLIGSIDPCDETPGDCPECESDADCAVLGTTCHCPGGPPCPAATNPGVCVTGKYDWTASGFPLSPGSDPDGLNTVTTDGEVYFLANARVGVLFPEPKAPVLSDQALWVTTLEFLAIGGANDTTVSFDTCVGDIPTRTRVIGDGASNFITGDLGTVRMLIRECTTAAECNDGIACTFDSCDAQFQCLNAPENAACDDSVFCNGSEVCNPQVGCESPGDPCIAQGLVCKEQSDECVECLMDADCSDGLDCTDEVCNAGVCEFSDNCVDDGVFCNGTEFCEGTSNGCASSGDPCPGFCDEQLDECPACETPLVEAAGSRYIAITPQPILNPAPTAFLVESPDWPCLSKYVGAFLRCGGSGSVCTDDANCNSCTLLNSPCLTDNDCKTCQGTTNPCQSNADCGGACESLQVCELSGLTCDSSGFFDEFDIDMDGVPDGIVGTLVDDPADRAIMTAEEWGATSYFRCSQSQEPCVIDADCDVGQCAVSGRACSVSAADCSTLCAIAGVECGFDAECTLPGDSCSAAQACLPFETCQPGKIYVLSGDLLPSDVDSATEEFFPSTYTVRADCGALTAPANVQMRLWADADDNGLVNIGDAQLIILGFQGKYFTAIPSRTVPAFDIQGDACTPNQLVNINDVFLAIRAFKGDRFNPDVLNSAPDCSVPCP